MNMIMEGDIWKWMASNSEDAFELVVVLLRVD